MTERLHFPFSLSCTGEGNGNPLQCSCLENPRDAQSGLLLSESDPEYPLGAFLVAQIVKNVPAMQETQVQSLGRKDLLEKRMATHSTILAWRIPWTEEPGGLQSMGSKKAGRD